MLTTERADLSLTVSPVLSAAAVLTADGPVKAIGLAPDEDALAVECQGELSIMDPATWEVRRRWRADGAKVRRLEYSPDGALLVTAGYEGAVTLWDAATGEPVRSFAAHQGRVWSVSFSRDGALVASAGEDHIVRLWRTRGVSGSAFRAFRGHTAPVRSVAVSPDGRWVASGDEAHELYLWDVSGERLERRLLGHTGKVRCVRFLPDGSLISGGSDGTVRVWDPATGAQSRCMQAHGAGRVGKIRTVALSADHRVMVTGAQDHTARVWTAPDWRPHATLHGHEDVLTSSAVALRHRHIFTAADDHTVRRWPLG